MMYGAVCRKNSVLLACKNYQLHKILTDLNIPVINLDVYDLPNLKDIVLNENVTCNFHISCRNDKYSCALKKCTAYWNFLK